MPSCPKASAFRVCTGRGDTPGCSKLNQFPPLGRLDDTFAGRKDAAAGGRGIAMYHTEAIAATCFIQGFPLLIRGTDMKKIS